MSRRVSDVSDSPDRRSRSRSRGRRSRHLWQPPRYTVYVLKLTDGKWYVGRTTKPLKQRLQEHVSGRLAAVWSRKHEPIRLVESMRSGSGVTQLSITKEYMALYGIDNVRGSCYCRVELTPAERQKLELDIRQIRAELDLCYHCGGKHFAAHCRQATTSSHRDINLNSVMTLKDILNIKNPSPTSKTQKQSPQDHKSAFDSNSHPSYHTLEPVVSTFTI